MIVAFVKHVGSNTRKVEGHMSKTTPIDIFDILYGLCSQDGREAALFGDSIALVRPVIEKCIIGDKYPLFYVKFPPERHSLL